MRSETCIFDSATWEFVNISFSKQEAGLEWVEERMGSEKNAV